MFTFNKYYFLSFIILLLIEIGIAQLSGFIRHTFGDFLVVILLYCMVKSFVKASSVSIALGVLIFAFTVEFLQLTSILEWVGLEDNRMAKIIFGATFSVYDLLAYTLGVLFIVMVEKRAFIHEKIAVR
ncbi:ribosomal maturation YjgA family protein [Tenacibaculum xiamenense]|uniref:ribosomal maturation YjgA family protein n=1 Tax=Tenacibaculum xiamenense TaxID=1261553 RepID=UPI0038954C3C